MVEPKLAFIEIIVLTLLLLKTSSLATP